MELSDVHDCEKCRGKIVAIAINPHTGQSSCGYCGEVVNYQPYFDHKLKDNPTWQNIMKKRDEMKNDRRKNQRHNSSDAYAFGDAS